MCSWRTDQVGRRTLKPEQWTTYRSGAERSGRWRREDEPHPCTCGRPDDEYGSIQGSGRRNDWTL